MDLAPTQSADRLRFSVLNGVGSAASYVIAVVVAYFVAKKTFALFFTFTTQDTSASDEVGYSFENLPAAGFAALAALLIFFATINLGGGALASATTRLLSSRLAAHDRGVETVTSPVQR